MRETVFSLVLVASIAVVFSGVVYAQDSANVIVKINNGYDAFNIGQQNRIEFWFVNNQPLVGLALSFSFKCDSANIVFDSLYGNLGGLPNYVLDHHPSPWDACEFTEWIYEMPDSILFGGASLCAPVPSYTEPELCFSMLVNIQSLAPESDSVFCIDNEVVGPATWEFDPYTGGFFPPDYQGNPNTSVHIPDAPAVWFPVILPGDANNDGSTSIADAVFIIQYVFAGGPAPSLQQRGDCNCDQAVTVSDPVYLVNYIFAGGPAPGSDCFD